MEEDLISALPDNILLSIVSLLPMREALRTAVLSRKWRIFGKCISNLNFKVDNVLGDNFSFKCVENLDENEEEAFVLNRKLKFIEAVDQLLRLRPHGIKMVSLRICLLLDIADTSYLDRWIGQAVSCDIENLDLTLREVEYDYIIREKYYNFPFHIFSSRVKRLCSLKSLNLEYLTMRPHPDFCGFKSLTRLSLNHLKMSDRDLSQVLSGCSLLEWLSICFCVDLVNLEIPSKFFRLEHLEVTSCCNLENIHVRAPSVTTLEYEGRVINLLFDKVPLVKHATYHIHGDKSGGIKYIFSKFSMLLPQLESLELFCWCTIEEGTIPPYFPPQFTNLKRLLVSTNNDPEHDLLWLISLLLACPLLEELLLDLNIYEEHDSYYEGQVMKLNPRCPLKYLKVVEIRGFMGFWNQIDFASRLLRDTVSLETMTIVHNDKDYVNGKWETGGIWKGVKRYRRRIHRFLSKKVPKGAKLILID